VPDNPIVKSQMTPQGTPNTGHETYEEGVARRTAQNWKDIRADEVRRPIRGVARLSDTSMIPEAAARVDYPEGFNRAASGGRLPARSSVRSSGRR
jgi:hypothetical protein